MRIPLIRAVAAVTDAVVDSAGRQELQTPSSCGMSTLSGTIEVSVITSVRSRLVGPVLGAVTVVVVDPREGDLDGGRKAGEHTVRVWFVSGEVGEADSSE